jgi:hypothetical protein
MVGEENRREVIIPTERIRNGMPVSSDVANELSSIGVPGFFDGGTVGGFSTSVGGPGYGNRNRGSVASSGSIGEQKRREQESRSINEAYRRDLKAQHNERLEALINIERNTGNTSTLLGGSGGGGLTNVNYRFPRRRGGGGLNIDPIKDMPKDFIDAFKQGFLNEYQEWRKSLVGDQRQTVELLHDLYDMYGIYGKQGMRGVYRHAATDKGVEQRLDWIISKIGGSGSFVDRESMALTQGLRAGMMSDVLGGNWRQNLGVGLSTTLFSSGVYRMQNALDYRNYVPPQPPQPSQPSQPETPSSTGEPIVLWAPSPLEGEGVGLRDPRVPQIGELYSSDSSLMTNFDNRLTGNISARGEASILNRIKGSRMGQAIGDRYQRTKQGFGKLFEGSQQMVKDPKTGAMVPTGEKGGFFSSAAGAATLQGLGAAGLQLATGGFGRKNVGAAVSTGFSAAGAALSTMGPYGMVAGIGLNIAGGLIGNAIAGSSKAVKRNKAMAGLKKAIDNKDMSTFRNKKALAKTLRQPSSRGRTLVAIQALLGGLPNPLSSRELGALTSYLINSNASETDHAFWNKRLFDKDSDKLTGDNTFENLQTQMNESNKFDNELESSADNILERWRKDRGYESDDAALEALGIDPDSADARDITKLTTAISQQSGGSQFLERHMMSMSEEEYAEAQSGGDGGGGQITMPPELTQYMLELNNNVRKMGQDLGSQTFNVIIKMDSREVAQAVVEAQSETADNGSVG